MCAAVPSMKVIPKTPGGIDDELLHDDADISQDSLQMQNRYRRVSMRVKKQVAPLVQDSQNPPRQDDFVMEFKSNEIEITDDEAGAATSEETEKKPKNDNSLFSNPSELPQNSVLFLETKLIQANPNYLRKISDFEFIQQSSYQQATAEFWKANDLKTGTTCIIKETQARESNRNEFISYVQEVQALSCCQYNFVQRFVGYTMTYPFSIITQSLPNYSLDNYLRHPNGSPLTPNQLTIIAAAIAYAMNKIHSNDIVFRNLRLEHIYIDENKLPIITDFSQANFTYNTFVKFGFEIKETASMQAEPSMYDIYSYGVLLNNILTIVPVKQSSDENMIEKALIEELPTTKTQTPLTKLISHCMVNDPKQRPTFSAIFDKFATGKVLFPNADSKSVIHGINKYILNIDDPVPPKVCTDIQQSLAELYTRLDATTPKPKKHRKDFVQSHSYEVLIEKPKISSSTSKIPVMLVDCQPEVPKENSGLTLASVSNYLSQITLTIDPEDFESLYLQIKPIFSNPPEDLRIISRIIKFFVQIAERNPRFYYIFHAFKIYLIIPIKTQESVQYLFQLVCQTIKYDPKLFDTLFYRVVSEIIHQNPHFGVIIYANYVKNIQRSANPYAILDFFVSEARTYHKSEEGKQYLQIFYYLHTTYSSYHENRIDQYQKLLNAFTYSQHQDVAISAYCAIVRFIQDGYRSSMNKIMKDLYNPQLCSYVISLLLRSATFPPNPDFLSVLIHCTKYSSKIYYVLFKFVSTSRRHMKLFVQNTRWMLANPENIIPAFQILLYISKENKFIPRLTKVIEFPRLAKQLVQLERDDITCMLEELLLKIESNRNQLLLFSKAGFLKAYYTSVRKSNNGQVIDLMISLTKQWARQTYTEEFMIILPLLITLLQKRNALTTKSIVLIVTMSCYPSISKKLKEYGLLPYFQQLLSINELKDLAAFCIDNIQKNSD